MAGKMVKLPSLILVTGKGGTGKSSVAAALALACARRAKTVLADIGPYYARNSSAADIPRQAHRFGLANGASATPDNLEHYSLSPHTELEAFIQRIVPLKAIARRMLRSHTFGYVTAALPGLEAFLILDRMRLLAEQARERGGFVIVDGPASGGTVELLSVTRGIRELARAGTLHRLAQSLDDFMVKGENFAALLTVSPEQFAIREALETASILKNELHIRCLGVVINRISEMLFSAAECAAVPAGIHRNFALQRRAAAEMAARAQRQFEAAGIAVIRLPMLYTAVFGSDEIRLLAGKLERALVR